MGPKFRYIGITDECVTCQRCGKEELRSTVVIMPLDAEGNDEGEVTYYGSSCAGRALGVPAAKVRRSAQNAAYKLGQDAAWAREVLNSYGVPVDGEIPDRMAFLRQYAVNNKHVGWTSIEQVEESAMEMVERHRRTLREARLLGL